MSLIAQAENFLYFEDDFAERIEHWARPRCESFLPNHRELEQTLEQHRLYREYCELFEATMEGFLTINGVHLPDFYAEMRAELENSKRRGTTFAGVLAAAIEYDAFCDMMSDVRLGKGVVFCPPLVDVDDNDNDDSRNAMDWKEEEEEDLENYNVHSEEAASSEFLSCDSKNEDRPYHYHSYAYKDASPMGSSDCKGYK